MRNREGFETMTAGRIVAVHKHTNGLGFKVCLLLMEKEEKKNPFLCSLIWSSINPHTVFPDWTMQYLLKKARAREERYHRVVFQNQN